jgi:hypothetical protein
MRGKAFGVAVRDREKSPLARKDLRSREARAQPSGSSPKQSVTTIVQEGGVAPLNLMFGAKHQI